MTVRIEGLISRKAIRRWLDNWEGIQAGSPPDDYIPGIHGAKVYDGVSGTQLNRIMLEAAIRDLPPVLYICLQYRWVDQLPLGETLKRTGIPKTTYYRRCDKAVDFIYYHINGIAAGMKDLLEKIKESKA